MCGGCRSRCFEGLMMKTTPPRLQHRCAIASCMFGAGSTCMQATALSSSSRYDYELAQVITESTLRLHGLLSWTYPRYTSRIDIHSTIAAQSCNSSTRKEFHCSDCQADASVFIRKGSLVHHFCRGSNKTSMSRELCFDSERGLESDSIMMLESPTIVSLKGC